MDFNTVRVRGGIAVVRRLFDSLSYTVTAEPVANADGAAPTMWMLTLATTTRLQALLSQLYVLIPVLDDDKHYWVSADEIDKLLRHGEGWLAEHPEREFITRRYLRRGPRLAREALERLAALDAAPEVTADAEPDTASPLADEPASLNDLRHQTVLRTRRDAGSTSVLDLGCGEGKMLRLLLADPRFTRVTGADVSMQTLSIARERLNVDRLPDRQRERLTLLQTALTYRDRRLEGYDAAALVEVVEHIDLDRLPAFERSVFAYARPKTVIVTTPNRDWNATIPALSGGKLRHRDHRFEWSQDEFGAWTARIGEAFCYGVALHGIGDPDPAFGCPTQMAVFTCA